jgi:hypothetical protein
VTACRHGWSPPCGYCNPPEFDIYNDGERMLEEIVKLRAQVAEAYRQGLARAEEIAQSTVDDVHRSSPCPSNTGRGWINVCGLHIAEKIRAEMERKA